jgi:phosphoribosylglycinamide formyltransferase-1
MKWAVLVGGTGSNLSALLDYGLDVAVVISHRLGVGALDVAERHGVLTKILLANDYSSRRLYGAELRAVLTANGVEAVALAGFMRWLDRETVSEYAGKMFNIHPSLLPSFPGLHAVRQAIQHGVRWTGVTVHVVDDGQDTGPIVAQVPVPVLGTDTEDSLSHRIHRAEHALYGPVLRAFELHQFNIDGSRVVWRTEALGLERGQHAVGINQCNG